MKVPATSESELAKAAKAAVDRTSAPSGLVTKVLEEPGPSISQCLVKSNNFPRQSCGRPLWPWQAKGEKCRERCYREGVTYIGRCRRCREWQMEEGVSEKDIVDEVYIGESHRYIVTRCRSHFELYKPGKGGGGGKEL